MPNDALSQTDREIEKRVRNIGILLQRNPELVEREELIWLLGALLGQRDRFRSTLKQAVVELKGLESEAHDLIDVMTAYAEIRKT